jgi:hypothetical protein
LAVIFDSPEDLQEVWKLHEGKQLSSLFQSFLGDKAMLKALGIKKMTLRARLWEDEYKACLEETAKVTGSEAKRVNIHTRGAWFCFKVNMPSNPTLSAWLLC